MKNIIFNNLETLKSNSRILDFDNEYENAKNKLVSMVSKFPDCNPIFIAITGSTSYGLDLETSDIDLKGVYIQDLNSILSELKIGQSNPTKYQPQINGGEKSSDGKTKEDITLYELGRYLELIRDNNPNIMELYNTPEDCIVYKHPIWDDVVDYLKKSNVLTKKCYYTFHNYASQQIKKATGLNKKINNPINRERKTPIDFCHVIFNDDSAMELRAYLKKEKLDQKFCGLVKVPHARDLFGLYYDYESAKSFSKNFNEEEREYHRSKKIQSNEFMGLGYKGIIKENDKNEEVSNEIRVSSIPKNEKRLVSVSYNKDGYMKYCKDYSEYWDWVGKRNNERYKDNISSGQNYDGKNLSHCLRLLYMAKEIAHGKGVIVRRDNILRNQLLDVKKGRLKYDEIINMCEELTDGLEDEYKKSSLPDEISNETITNILFNIRTKFYFNK